MFSSSKQLERYERRMKWRNRGEMLKYWVWLFIIVFLFVALCDLAYRLSFVL